MFCLILIIILYLMMYAKMILCGRRMTYFMLFLNYVYYKSLEYFIYYVLFKIKKIYNNLCNQYYRLVSYFTNINTNLLINKYTNIICILYKYSLQNVYITFYLLNHHTILLNMIVYNLDSI